MLEEDLTLLDFKVNNKRQYLFGWDKMVREKIYLPHCWSPELQILSGFKLNIIYTALKTEKSGPYHPGNYIIPKE